MISKCNFNFKVAIENAEEPVRYQRSLLDKRKLARQEEKEREEEEDIRKASHADEELENMLEAGEGAMLMGHVKIEGNEDQLR